MRRTGSFLVVFRRDGEKDGYQSGKPGIDEETGCTDGAAASVLLFGEEPCDDGNEDVAQENRDVPEGGDDAFEAFRRLGVGELQPGGAEEDFANGEDEIGDELPRDTERFALFQTVLQPGDDGEGDGGQSDSRTHAEKGASEFSDIGIDENADDRNEDHHEDGVGRLKLFRPDGPCRPPGKGDVQGDHGLALNDPGGRRLVEEGPEGNDKDENREDSQDADDVADFGFPVLPPGVFRPSLKDDVEEDAPEAAFRFFTAWGNVDVLPPPQPEDECRQRHEDAGDGEGPFPAVFVPDGGDGDEGEEGTQVDRPVEGVVGPGHDFGGLVGNLVAHEGGDAGFDSAGAEAYDEKSRIKNPFACFD